MKQRNRNCNRDNEKTERQRKQSGRSKPKFFLEITKKTKDSEERNERNDKDQKVLEK